MACGGSCNLPRSSAPAPGAVYFPTTAPALPPIVPMPAPASAVTYVPERPFPWVLVLIAFAAGYLLND